MITNYKTSAMKYIIVRNYDYVEWNALFVLADIIDIPIYVI